MKEITFEQLTNPLIERQFVFVHTPFCGTCKLARKLIEPLESMEAIGTIYEMNASLQPQYMKDNFIKSVPCLLHLKKGEVANKMYSFESVTNIYEHLTLWCES
ncbi:thioredoxin family protein [Aquibacillus kalidii]|uniref:thioredoxin family protein n=1 Tax=Aquibacillus kalidii TaxID=2762597 RepID=UPI001648D56B|nr:thioredoxin family protein [Aquibacillus kalidii]